MIMTQQTNSTVYAPFTYYKRFSPDRHISLHNRIYRFRHNSAFRHIRLFRHNTSSYNHTSDYCPTMTSDLVLPILSILPILPMSTDTVSVMQHIDGNPVVRFILCVSLFLYSLCLLHQLDFFTFLFTTAIPHFLFQNVSSRRTPRDRGVIMSSVSAMP